MTRSLPRVLGAALLAGAVLCACGHGGATKSESEAPRAVKNPSDFPLYPRSEVVNVVPVDTAQMFAVIRAQDPTADLPRNFRGHVIMAETGATAAQLRSWVTALESSPPLGMHKAITHGSRSSDRKNGVSLNGDGTAQFENADSSRWVYVITADPKEVYRQAGPMFTMIEAYNAAPGFLRAPIDDAAKKSVGYTVTELLDVKSPAGAVLAELKRLQSVDRRAIVLIDEAKTT